jgi:adenylate kinase family enzyme
MQRILVIGTSGSGKSTLAQKIAQCLDLPYFATDPFYWEPGWKLAPHEKVLELVSDVVRREAWVMDGNFDNLRDLVWMRAECIIWLDYPLLTILRQVVARNFRWVITRQETWSGNRMTLWRAFSGIRHTLRSYVLKHDSYPRWLAELPETMEWYRFRSRREAQAWVGGLPGNEDFA